MFTDWSTVDTTPGSASVFAPPVGVVDSIEGYPRWAKAQLARDPGMRQLAYVCAINTFGRFHWKRPPVLIGPFTVALKAILQAIYTEAKGEPEPPR